MRSLVLLLTLAALPASAEEERAPEGAPRLTVERQGERLLVHTSVGDFETRAADVPPELLEALVGDAPDRRVWAEADTR